MPKKSADVSSARRISRRAFLRTLAAVPVAARFATPLFAAAKPRVAVVGAGAFGGWTALQLREMGADVVLLDEWGPGNSRSSSGGKTRVIRAIYGPDRIYVEMVKRAFELWEKIAATTTEPLYVPTGALWMHEGDDSYVRASLPILKDLGFEVDQFTVAEAAKKYPQINFNGVKSVYLERRAGALFARRACRVVANAVRTLRQATVKPGRIANAKMDALHLNDGSRVEADVYVFACGPWLGQLFPQTIGSSVRPTRQEVYYFSTPKGSDRYLPGHLPIWIDFGKRIIYGIPGVDAPWFKLADDTRGETIDPTTMQRNATPAGIERARQFLAGRFPEIAKQPLVAAEVCQYENSPDGNLIIDRHPEARNVWLLGGGSGHGFKLSPAIGEIAANAILNGREVPKMFHLDRLGNVKQRTQFETHG